jgi:adenosylcobinamide amidohydrolase
LTPVASELRVFGGSPALAALAWRLDRPLRAVSTAPVGGGLGERAWVLNVQVPSDYTRRDPAAHVAEVAAAFDLGGEGVGMLTAASVERVAAAEHGDVRVEATVGLSHPVWAAAGDNEGTDRDLVAGTINVVAFLPTPHGDAALANALCTVTEAKTQALLDAGVPGTGTPSDAVTVLCPIGAAVEVFGGPRSTYGAPLARAVYDAVRGGIE